MPLPTAKSLRAAATSVAGARSMGIETAASKAAPAMLAEALSWLDKNAPCGAWDSRLIRWAPTGGFSFPRNLCIASECPDTPDDA